VFVRFPGAESRLHISVKRIAAKMLATPSGILADPMVTIEGEHILEISTRSAQQIAHIDYDFPDRQSHLPSLIFISTVLLARM
jgi:hypothetical protein